MRDKRPVDELSIEELERILAIKKREARQQRLDQMRRSGRVLEPAVIEQPTPNSRDAHEPRFDRRVRADEPESVVPKAVKITVDPVASPRLAEMERLAMIDQGITPMFDDDDDDNAPAASGASIAIPTVNVPTSRAAKPKRAASWYDRILLVVEVAAVIGIVVIGANLIGAIGKLEEETASAQQIQDEVRRAGIPTIEPTPTVRLENIVLPGGHTSPLDPGGAQFNYEEVPAIYRPLVQSQWVQPVVSRPPVTSETALNINIPRLSLDASIVQGVDWEALKAGVGQLPNAINPGDVEGNVVLAAHNDIYGELFRHLDQLQPGDPFQIRTATQVYNYVVTEQLIVDPNDVYVMENRGIASVTLISCYPYQVNSQRIVIYAERMS